MLFANSGGRYICVGVANNGNLVGTSDPDDELLKIMNMVHDSES